MDVLRRILAFRLLLATSIDDLSECRLSRRRHRPRTLPRLTRFHRLDNFHLKALDQHLLRGIYSYGFEKPSAIQMRAIVPCTKGYDVIAQAQSGTGKTATFAISCLQQIDVNRACTQALILGPTRELAQQIQKVVLLL